MVRGVALKDERLPENGQHRAQTDELADVGRIDLTPNDLHFFPQVVDLQPLCRRCWPVSHEVDGWPQEGGVASTGPRKQDDVAEQLQVAHDRREVVVAEIRQHAEGLAATVDDNFVSLRHVDLQASATSISMRSTAADVCYNKTCLKACK